MTAEPPLGFVERLDASSATGWALDGPDGPALIQAWSGLGLAGEAWAKTPREDVSAALKTHGRSGGGFTLYFERALSMEEQEGLVLRAGGRTLPRVATLAASRRAFPVFIVGSPRSGTSILTIALQRAGYTGFEEGNFLSLLTRLHEDVDAHFHNFGTDHHGVLTAHIDPCGLKTRLAEVLRAQVEPFYGGRPWFDKTGNPEMITAIPALRSLWPDAVFIFAKRRGIENLASRLRKFPQYDFAYHCRDWARNMAGWRALRAVCPDLRALEVDQRHIAEAPAATAMALGTFLNLQPAAIETIKQVFSGERPQETAPGTAVRRMTLASTGWGEDLQEQFRALCGAEMAAFHYTEDEQYESLVPA
jgi:hypothetical protein